MSPWHVDDSALQAYAAQELATLERASVEAHVMRCDACRGGLARLAPASVGTVSFDALFDRVQTRIELAPSDRATRWLRRVGVTDADTVVVRQIGRQSLQWTIAATLILALAALAATLAVRDSAQLGFVLLAPLLPALGFDTDVARSLALLAMGAGSMAVSHTNDSYFWVVTKFSALETATVLKSYSLATAAMGLVGLATTWILYFFAK